MTMVWLPAAALSFDMSKILCIVDGMTDPNFKAEQYPGLAAARLQGFVDTTQGQPAESLGCILRILGISSVPPHLRGYAEALGCGIGVGPNDLVLRGSWFALNSKGQLGLPMATPPALAHPANCRYHPLGQYKSLLVFPGMAECAHSMSTLPPYACGGRPARALCPRGCGAAAKVFWAQLTDDRCLVLWGQSAPAKLPPFGQPAAVVCGTPVVKGIARLLGMTLLPTPAATGDVDTDLAQKLEVTLAAARQFPFVLLHINGADEAAHRQNSAEKSAFLRKVDSLVLQKLLRSNHSVFVLADHGTDPRTGQHVGGPQPLFTNLPSTKEVCML